MSKEFEVTTTLYMIVKAKSKTEAEKTMLDRVEEAFGMIEHVDIVVEPRAL